MKKLLLIFALLSAKINYAQTEFDFEKLNEKYYHLDLAEFSGFRAEIKGSFNFFLEENNEEKGLSFPDSICIMLDYFSPDDFRVEIKDSSKSHTVRVNPQLETIINQAIPQYLQGWSKYVFSPIIDYKNYHLSVSKMGDSYQLLNRTDTTEAITYVSPSLLVDSVKFYAGRTVTVMKLHYIDYKDKKAVNSIESSWLDGLLIVNMKFEMNEIGKYLLPIEMIIEQSGGGIKSKINIQFTNIKLYDNK